MAPPRGRIDKHVARRERVSANAQLRRSSRFNWNQAPPNAPPFAPIGAIAAPAGEQSADQPQASVQRPMARSGSEEIIDDLRDVIIPPRSLNREQSRSRADQIVDEVLR